MNKKINYLKTIFRNIIGATLLFLVLVSNSIISNGQEINKSKTIYHKSNEGETLVSIGNKYGLRAKDVFRGGQREKLFMDNISEKDSLKPLPKGSFFQLSIPVKLSETKKKQIVNKEEASISMLAESKVLSAKELESLINKVNDGKKAFLYRSAYDYKTYYYPLDWPVAFYCLKNFLQQEQKLMRKQGISFLNLKQNNLDIKRGKNRNPYKGKYDNYIYYRIDPISYKIEGIDENVTAERALVKANNRVQKLINIRDSLTNEINSLKNNNNKANNWVLNEKEVTCLRSNGKIPFASGAEKRQKDKNQQQYKGYWLHKLKQELNEEGEDIELAFKIKYEKNYSKTKEAILTMSLFHEQKEKYKKRSGYTNRINLNGVREKKPTQPVYKTLERTKEVSNGYIKILLSKKEAKNYLNARILKKDGKIEVFINNKSRGTSLLSGNKETGIYLSGNHVAIKDITIKPVLSKLNMKRYEEKIQLVKREINSIGNFFRDIEKSCLIGEKWKSYTRLKLTLKRNQRERGYNSVNYFVNSNPKFKDAEEFKYYLDYGKEKLQIQSIMAENTSLQIKYSKLKSLQLKGTEVKRERNEGLKKIYTEVESVINHNVDSICESLANEETAIKELVAFSKTFSELEIDAGGEKVVKKILETKIKERSKNIANSQKRIATKITEMYDFIYGLDEFSKSTYAFEKGKQEVFNLMNKTIKSTVNMYYNTVQRKMPLVKHKEVRDETDIVDAMFGKKRYATYTWKTGGETYTDVTGYEMSGSITNICSKEIEVLVRSEGYFKTTGNLLVDGFKAMGALTTGKGKYEKDVKSYKLKPGQKVNYKLSGKCNNNANMKIIFNVVSVGNIYTTYN